MDTVPVTLSISIVNTNNRELLNNCLKSIYETTKDTSFEIIVVDNKSDDGSAQLVKENFPEVLLIENTSRQGYGYNHNRAFEISKGDFFLVFNEDMIIVDNALDKMVKIATEDKSIGALGCRLLNPDGTLQPSCSNEYTFLTCLFDDLIPYRLAGKSSPYRTAMYQWSHDEERDVGVIMGCCMLIPREVAEETGLFDEQFFVYYEETDLCRRIRQSGKRVCFTPEGQVIHYGGQTSKTMRRAMRIVFLESRHKYYVKYYGESRSIFLRCIQTFSSVSRLVGWAAIKVLRPKHDVATFRLKQNWTDTLWCFRLLG